MKRVLGNRWIAQSVLCAALVMCARPATAAGDEVQPVLQADEALTQAIRKGDKTAVSGVLADNFEFTNAEGKTFSKTQALDALATITTAGPEVSDMHTYNYGELGYTIGLQKDTRFMRVWTKQPVGWRLFIYLETPVTARAPVAEGGGDCDNPCKTIPYSPANTADKGIIEAWQKAKMDEWHPNAEDWALHVADEFLMINARTERPKAERVALLAKQEEKHEVGPPGDPIHNVRIFGFGANAAVMLSVHTPYHGGKPYYNVRIWVLRDGRWQLGMSQQTTVVDAAPVVAVG